MKIRHRVIPPIAVINQFISKQTDAKAAKDSHGFHGRSRE
jgi:hypothetical protein